AVMYFYSDLIKHHPHSIDLVSMLLGDPAPAWVEGRLEVPDDASGSKPGRPAPAYDPAGHRFVPPPGREIADPMVGYFRVGYQNGAEALFVPMPGGFEIEVLGTEGRASASEAADDYRIRRARNGGAEVTETVIRPRGD